jgi:hypothetical protein
MGEFSCCLTNMQYAFIYKYVYVVCRLIEWGRGTFATLQGGIFIKCCLSMDCLPHLVRDCDVASSAAALPADQIWIERFDCWPLWFVVFELPTLVIAMSYVQLTGPYLLSLRKRYKKEIRPYSVPCVTGWLVRRVMGGQDRNPIMPVLTPPARAPRNQRSLHNTAIQLSKQSLVICSRVRIIDDNA